MATPRRESTGRIGGPLRALPVVAVAASIVAVATHYDGFVSTGTTVPRAASTFDVRKSAVFVCPMDPDVRSNGPGKCRRCGMALVAGIPEPVEFHLDLTTTPSPPASNQGVTLEFHVHDTWKDHPVQKFVRVHEKLFHAFVVSEDLNYFNHGHPVLRGDGVFAFPVVLPKGGMFRVLGVFYPDGATPQLLTETLFVPEPASPKLAERAKAGGTGEPPTLSRDYSTKSDANMTVSLTTLPEQSMAGNRTRMTFHVDPLDGFEKYLGAWG